jgi:hypothetical protein
MEGICSRKDKMPTSDISVRMEQDVGKRSTEESTRISTNNGASVQNPLQYADLVVECLQQGLNNIQKLQLMFGGKLYFYQLVVVLSSLSASVLGMQVV